MQMRCLVFSLALAPFAIGVAFVAPSGGVVSRVVGQRPEDANTRQTPNQAADATPPKISLRVGLFVSPQVHGYNPELRGTRYDVGLQAESNMEELCRRAFVSVRPLRQLPALLPELEGLDYLVALETVQAKIGFSGFGAPLLKIDMSAAFAVYTTGGDLVYRTTEQRLGKARMGLNVSANYAKPNNIIVGLANALVFQFLEDFSKTETATKPPGTVMPPSSSQAATRAEFSGRSDAPEAVATRSDRWALIVGISQHGASASDIGNLRYARRDAEDFRNFLLTPSGGGFEQDKIDFLADEQATGSNLRSGLRDFLGRAAEDDLVIIYFAGHGVVDPARPSALYLVTYDTDLDRLGGTAVDMDEITTALNKNITARRVVVFVDSCHSGGIQDVGTTPRSRSAPSANALINAYLDSLARSRPGVVVFTASQGNEPSFEGEQWGGGHGVFTYFLLSGLAGAADRNGDGKVTIQELMDYVSDNVKRATDYKQHPTPKSSTWFDPNLPMAVMKGR